LTWGAVQADFPENTGRKQRTEVMTAGQPGSL
jgi:hypothetical protein